MWAAMPIIRDIIYGAARYGAPAGKLCQMAGLDISSLEDANLKVPLEQAQKVWEIAVNLTQDPYLGLHIGENTTTSVVGMVGHLMQTSSTLKEAFDSLSRYTEVVTGMFHYETELTESYFTILLNPSAYWQEYYTDTAQQAADQAMAGSLNVCRLLTGRTVAPVVAELAREKPVNTAEYENILKAPLRFDMPANRLVFDAAVARLPVLGFNKDLQRFFKQMSDDILKKESETSNFSQTIQQTIVNNFSCIPSLSQVASYLSLTERTLQRRLEKEGTSFQKITEEIRKGLAIKLLKTDKYSITEAAYMLGYAEPAVFRRAFKRWTGKTPRQAVK